MGLRDDLRRSAGGFFLDILSLVLPVVVDRIRDRFDAKKQADEARKKAEEAQRKIEALQEAERKAKEYRERIEAERTASRVKAQKAKQEVHNANSNYQGPRKP